MCRQEKAFVKSEMNKDRFQEYFAQLKALNMGEGGGSWAEAVSPYGS
jgi:hypothetical protein